MKDMFQGIESATGVGDFANGQFSEFDVRWSKTQGTQKMFRTKRGYYGMGPVSLEKGDQVWVLCDGRVPFVLRSSRVEGAYELVGETYLHGCMRTRNHFLHVLYELLSLLGWSKSDSGIDLGSIINDKNVC